MRFFLLTILLTFNANAVDVIKVLYPTAHSGFYRTKINDNSFFHTSTSNFNSSYTSKYVSFNATVPTEGFYRLEANVKAPTGGSNSFFVKVNDAFSKYWNIPITTSPRFRTAFSEVYLKAGYNKITFYPREKYTQVADTKMTFVRSLNPVYSLHFNDLVMPSMQNPRNPHLLSVVAPGVLRAEYQITDRGSARILWEKTLAAANQYTLSYRVKFHTGFDFARGGKIHGMGPRNPSTGCSTERADGWSNRVNFGPGGTAYLYIYRQDRPNRCGEAFYGDSNFRFQTNRWYTVALYTKINSSLGSSDGVAKLYIDGKQIVQKDGIRFRGEATSRSAINKFLFSTFHGGSNSSYSPSSDTTADFDFIRVIRGDFPGQ